MITTERLTMRKPVNNDWEDIHDYMQHGTIQEYMPQTPTDFTENDARTKVASLQTLRDSDDAEAWVVEHIEDDTVIGIVDEDITIPHRTARLGYHLSPAYQRRGLMTEALKAIITDGFANNIHKFTAEIAAANKASRRFIESLGFREEGNLRAELFIKGSFHDVKRYGLIEEEWNHE